MDGYDDPWIAPCGKALSDHLSMTCHSLKCDECLEILWRDVGYKPPPEPNDADDRGICYEKD